DRLTIDGVVRRLPHAFVVPRGLRIVLLVREDQPLRCWGYYRFELQARIAPHLFTHGAPERVAHVRFLPFEHGQPRRWIGDALHHKSLDVWHLAPVVSVRLHDDFDTRLKAHEAIGPQSDRLLLELFAAELLGVILRHDPARPGGWGGVEGQKIWPG